MNEMNDKIIGNVEKELDEIEIIDTESIEEKINNAVEEVIRKLVKNPKFEEAILNKIGSRIDTEEIEKEIERGDRGESFGEQWYQGYAVRW